MTNTELRNINRQEKFEFPNKEVSVLFIEDPETGWTIRLNTTDDKGMADNLVWSFGPDESMADISWDWGTYVLYRVKNVNVDFKIEELMNELGDIHCVYTLHKAEEDHWENLQDLGEIVAKLSDPEFQKTLPGNKPKKVALTNMKPRIAVVVDGGSVQKIISDIDLEAFVIDYDTKEADPVETIPLWGDEAYLYENPTVEVAPGQISALQIEIMSGEEVRKLRVETEKELEDIEYIGAITFTHPKHSLYPSEYTQLLQHVPQDEAYMIDRNYGDRSVVGFIKKSLVDDVEVLREIDKIGDDYTLHPKDGIVKTKSGHNIAVIERVNGSDGGEK